eukprot:TRINITY_DN5744_c0_g1_i2.p1 TRINITY_DN5744_c0_g1~~TRINITY_DN5744_c0_g1_i2.p1  ORF type:complete len:157 (+),score=11.04 TRINITY_DN5744_c0_g1_i2:3-473(+)
MLRRVLKEVESIQLDPPSGVSCWPKGDSLNEFEGAIEGAENTPYAGGLFKLEISLPSNYPFAPPSVRFATKIYHPNIDEGGRICLDTLKMPPPSARDQSTYWRPSLNIKTVLLTLQALLSHPNPDDGLVAEIRKQENTREDTRQTMTVRLLILLRM